MFQNTFLQVYVKSGQYEAGRPVRPWLYTIATNQAIDALRRNSRHQLLSLDQQREELADGELSSLVETLESHGPDPSRPPRARNAARRSVPRSIACPSFFVRCWSWLTTEG